MKKILTCLTFIIWVACSEMDVTLTQTKLNDQIQQAKEWFDSQPAFVIHQQQNLGARNAGIPDWQHAIQVERDSTLILEIPLTPYRSTVTSIGNGNLNKSFSKLLIRKRKGQYDASVMMLISYEESDQKSAHKIETSSLENSIKNYSGIISFFKWGSSLPYSSYLVQSGKLNNKNAGDTDKGKNTRWNCFSITINYYVTVCSEYGCSTRFDYSTSENYCVYEAEYESDLPPEYGDMPSGGGGLPEPELIVGGDDPFAIPIPDINQHLKCFDPTKPARITIYVDQPVHNGNHYFSMSDGVGHSFLGIEQDGNIRTIGFYPQGTASPLYPDDPMQFKDNMGKQWDVSISFEINANELSALLNYTKNNTPATYDLNTFNCTNWIISACSSMNIHLPQTIVNWSRGGGLSPGQFGQDMRNFTMSGRQITTSIIGQVGNAPSNSSKCQ